MSSFGFSGTNAHVVLQAGPEAKAVPANEPDCPRHILTLSGANAKALTQLAAGYAAAPAGRFADFCWSANTGRSPEAHRLAIVADDADEMRGALAAFAEGQKSEGVFRAVVESGDRPKVAFLFTGQGSQYARMGQGLYRTQPVFRAALDRCSDILARFCDRPCSPFCFRPKAPPACSIRRRTRSRRCFRWNMRCWNCGSPGACARPPCSVIAWANMWRLWPPVCGGWTTD